ncbi:serine hydrolase [Synechococcus elongatus]|uniref:Serine hydrolase n=1 Tax=Synechococcus elongatus PCC 11801 TaxID=2219813 RepID=A0AAN1QQ34_SYNEL|nr:serine hydrolase [Synechococcus elongatus]AZB73406.1 serine hydrolase [Synechococcus elongatus PCC 11801]
MLFFETDATLARWGEDVLAATWAEFPQLARNQLALTWIVYDDPVPVNTGGAIAPQSFWSLPIRGFHYRGDEAIYPASIVKLFYLVAALEWLQQGMIQPSAELDRALRDMIVDSSNDATGYIVDLLSGTTSGPELGEGPFKTWQFQRNIVNRYYQSLMWPELQPINVNQKTWGDGPYGRERAFYGPEFENRNKLTTNATARLLHAIAGGVAVSPSASQRIMNLLNRPFDPRSLADDPENQVAGFLGQDLPQGSQLWSKAGWMSRVRHDAAYLEIPGLPPHLLVVFTEGKEHANNEAVLPFIAQQVRQQIQPA